jgi:BASS family bile acid:Na+ symporter
MKELLVNIVKLGLPLSIMVSMFAQGLGIAPSQLTLFKARPWLALRSLGVVLILVPLAALALILLFNPSRSVAIGLAILVACPPSPMMLVKVPKRGGSLAYVAGLHLSLALLALVTVPITLYLLSRAIGFHVEVDTLAVARVVGMTILLPVCIGILVGSLLPRVAAVISPPLAKIGGVALLVLGLFVVAMTYRLLLKMDPWSYFVMAIVIAVSIAIGHWLAPGDAEERATLAMESVSRHPGLAMTIAVLNFSPQQALPVLIPYLIVSTVVMTVYLQLRKRFSAK